MKKITIMLIVLVSLVGCGGSSSKKEVKETPKTSDSKKVCADKSKKFSKLESTVFDDLGEEQGHKESGIGNLVYRGFITEVKKASDKGDYLIIKQMDGGYDYGTPEFVTYAPNSSFEGKIEFKVGDYVESKYSVMPSENTTSIYCGCYFPTTIITQLVKEGEDVRDGGQYVGHGTVVSAAYNDSSISNYIFNVKDSKTNEVVEMHGESMAMDREIVKTERGDTILKEGDVVDYIYHKNDQGLYAFSFIIKHE